MIMLPSTSFKADSVKRSFFAVDVNEKPTSYVSESKRKIRNQDEKKRRDQFNQILRELEDLLYESNETNLLRLSKINAKRRDKCSILKDSLYFLRNVETKSQLGESSLMSPNAQSTSIQDASFASSTDGCIQSATANSFDVKTSSDHILDEWRTPHLTDNELFLMLEDSLDMFYLIVKVTANADLLFVSKGFGHECYGVKCKRSTKSLPCPGSLFDILHEPDRSQFQALLNRCTSDLTGQPSSNQMFVFECKLLRRVNLDRNCECSDERDQPSYERMRACVSIRRFVDLTGRVHSYLLCVCKPWQPRMLKEVPLHYDDDDRTLNAANSRSNRNHSFSSRHSIEWKFLWIEEQSFLYLGYPTFELLGNSTFDYYHWGDLEPIANAHRQLLSGWDNCITTPKYRFLTKSQQWIWMQSSCTLVPNLPARSQIGGDPNPITVQTASADSRQANLILCENHVLQEATTAPFIRTAVNTLNKDLGRTSCPLTHDLSKPKTIIKDNRSGLSSDSSSVYPSSSSSNSSCLPQQFGQSCNSNVYPSTGSSSDQNTPSGASSTGQSLSGDSKSVATSSSLVVVQSTPGSFKSISKSAPDFDYIMSRRFELEKEIQEKQFQLQHLSEQLNNYQNASSN